MSLHLGEFLKLRMLGLAANFVPILSSVVRVYSAIDFSLRGINRINTATVPGL